MADLPESETGPKTKSTDMPGKPLSPARRRLLQALPALALSPALMAQSSSPIAVQKLHSFDIRVSDVERSLRFYQDLFGAAIQARAGQTVYLRIGSGPRCFSLSPVGRGEQPGFSHIGLSVAGFDADAVQAQLAAFGIQPGPVPAPGAARLDSAMRSWVVERGTARELYFADIEGIRYHLTAESWCGGGGELGNQCASPQPAPSAGFFALQDLSHFTTFLANRDRANEFYTRVFGKSYQAYQGPTSPVIGVGDGLQFLMYVGGSQAGAPANPGRIDHVCFSMSDFNVDAILQRLTDYGLRAREDAGNTQPLMHWVSMRMPNRGGAEGGTPEVYFSDPDGISIQLQDPGYCGGGGYLGDSCPPLA